ncbi:MAG: hypothetical protein KGH86_04865 [Thaumarchaeota archaeon]|nr:hypothetical protein [Nitrososphaerota archaeon]MDE1817120.1 hypothetical protein [Nitrososphaerota archaeon]MDE1876141.1 hypothetical protein [Nitrososphaerota archaeon]
MAVEKWIAVASFGMLVMFVAQMISISVYLSHPAYDIDPSSEVKEFISISVAPGLVLAGISFMLARKYGSRFVGSLLIAGGIVTIVGMFYVSTLMPKIISAYIVPELTLSPIVFSISAIPVIAIGALLFKLKPMPKRDYFFDG